MVRPKALPLTLLAVLLLACLSIQTSQPMAHAAPSAKPTRANWSAAPSLAANGWGFTNVVAVGESGFTDVVGGRVGDNGHTVVEGTSGGRTGVFLVQGTAVTEIATDATVLPGGLGSIGFVRDYAVTAQGDVLFTAAVSGGSLPGGNYAFRWSGGSITQQQPTSSAFTHTPSHLASNGRWLAEISTGTFPNHTLTYHYTDGSAASAIFSYTNSSGSCVSDLISQATPNANGVIAYYDQHAVTPFVAGRCATEQGQTRSWGIKLAGATTATLASGSAFAKGGALTGSEADTNNPFFLNNQNQVASVRRVYDGTSATQYQAVVSSAQGGEQVLLDTTSTNASTISLAAFDHEGRVVLSVLMDDFSTVAILGGPSLANDLILQTGQTLFGQTVTGLGVVSHGANAPAGTFGDNRSIAFHYQLQDGTTGIALAGKQVTRWTNAAGGSWATAGNWTPNEVPGSASATLFNLDATYDVDVGTRQSGRSNVEAGSVAFTSANLTLTGPFSVGGSASFTLPSGRMTANDLLIGHLPPINPASPPTARVNISNSGTVFTATAQTIIGQAGAGDLFISGGRLDSGEALLGAGSPGTAVVGGHTALWNISSLNVGAGHPATLTIENGGQVVVANAGVIGQASALQPDAAQIVVDNVGAATPALGNLRVGQLTVGDALMGTLDIQHGGVVAVLDLLQVGLQAHNTPLGDGRIITEGADGLGEQASSLIAFKDALFGMGDGARGDWQIFGGGAGSVLGDLNLGHTAGSRGTLSVSGISLLGGRSKLEVGTDAGTETCRVGFDGRGSVIVLGGALLTCNNMNIGGNLGSLGDVTVTGQTSGGTPSTLQVARALCVGGSPLCGSSTTVPGTLTLQNGGLVQVDSLAVAASGRLLGQGKVEAAFMVIAGEVAPGIGLSPQTSAAGQAGLAAVAPATLTISATVEISDTAIISLDIHAPDSYDQIEFTGPTKLGGQIVLNFGEGFAPQQGDVFTFIRADGATGTFAKVIVTGLAEGFAFNLTTTNGEVTLTALNDGVATTQKTQTVFLPLVRR
ncbi:hypothetical protein EKD04_018095 [Chloroflexales bacterium ZM16-3]|nr:hypothetical protein [Chloroflexales bacterium ZM16-3]